MKACLQLNYNSGPENINLLQINECVASDLVGNPDLHMRFIEEQEIGECIEEEICNMS